ncbi:MAG: DUF4190 domain-containing protein [Armatimonadetes bacterium]|nr:DUF4190 domain-containing protein [Armatimonadota bacterium]
MADDDQTLEPTEDDESCCGGSCSCGMAKEVAPDDLALIALVSGVASLFLCMGTPGHRFLGLLFGATAVVTGWAAQRTPGRREKQALTGIICGTIGLSLWLLATWMPGAYAWLCG